MFVNVLKVVEVSSAIELPIDVRPLIAGNPGGGVVGDDYVA